jgi:hypothetical protein
MVKVRPSKLIRESGAAGSAQRKVFASCCVEACTNEFEVSHSSPGAADELKNGRAFYACGLHQKDPEVAQAVASLKTFLDE